MTSAPTVSSDSTRSRPSASTTSNASTRSPTVAVVWPVPWVPVEAMPATRTFSSTTFHGMHSPKRASSRLSCRLVTPASAHTAGRAGSETSTSMRSRRSQKISVSSVGTSDDHENPEATTRTRCPLARASTTASIRSSTEWGVHTNCARQDAMLGPVDPGHAPPRAKRPALVLVELRLEPRPVAGVEQALEPEVERTPDHGVGRVQGRVEGEGRPS